MSNIILTASCIFGVEAILAGEIKKLGFEDVEVKDGRVSYACHFSDIPKANIHLRVAERVLVKITEFQAKTFDELFDGINAIDWSFYLSKDASFPVDVTSIDSQLFGISACQSIVKKAIVDKLKSVYHMEVFPETGPRYKVSVSLLKDLVTVYIDTSGTGLHKRGYRTLTGIAPLKETLAASMIMISRWKKDRVLYDPLCGTGTIPIEAALIGKNIAPGLGRQFISEGWPQISDKAWVLAREEANDLIERSVKLNIQGSDIDEKSLDMARYHSRQAGTEIDIHFQKRDVREISSSKQYGFIICNPPYGERVGEKEEVEKLYVDMGKIFDQFPTWSKYILTAYKGFEKFYGKKADKRRKLYNGMINCTYYQYFGLKPPR
ncbi:MAG TPA: RNA methyltransferase [Clostridiales bacterium]|nr:RNA methyltransferase [Clostridiales bacterium]